MLCHASLNVCQNRPPYWSNSHGEVPYLKPRYNKLKVWQPSLKCSLVGSDMAHVKSLKTRLSGALIMHALAKERFRKWAVGAFLSSDRLAHYAVQGQRLGPMGLTSMAHFTWIFVIILSSDMTFTNM